MTGVQTCALPISSRGVELNGLWISDSYPCSRSTRTGYNNHSELSYLGYLGAVTVQSEEVARFLLDKGVSVKSVNSRLPNLLGYRVALAIQKPFNFSLIMVQSWKTKP